MLSVCGKFVVHCTLQIISPSLNWNLKLLQVIKKPHCSCPDVMLWDKRCAFTLHEFTDWIPVWDRQNKNLILLVVSRLFTYWTSRNVTVGDQYEIDQERKCGLCIWSLLWIAKQTRLLPLELLLLAQVKQSTCLPGCYLSSLIVKTITKSQ